MSFLSKVSLRSAMWIFVAVYILMLAQLSWWIFFQMRSAQQQALFMAEQLHSQREIADRLWDFYGHDSKADAKQWQKQFFPYLMEASSETAERTASKWAIRPEVLEDLRLAKEAHFRMFAFEGSFFLFLVALGGMVIWRVLQREQQLILQQTNFLSAMSHELKSPLASIHLYVQTMLLRTLSEATQKRYLQTIQSDVQRLDHLMNNLLDVAKANRQQLHLKLQPVPWPTLLHETVKEIQQQHPQLQWQILWQWNNVLVEDFSDETLAQKSWVWGHPQACCTIVRNLLDNAIKYTGTASLVVTIALSEQRGGISLQIIDNGMGIAAQEQVMIFQQFYRVGDEMVRQVAGSGLGLYLANILTQSMQGRLSVASMGLGKGSTFTLWLRQAQPPEANG